MQQEGKMAVQSMVRGTSRQWVYVCLVVMIPGLGGCGRGKPAGISFAAVTGMVTLDGEPLPQAFIRFEPESGRPSFGRTDSAGAYSLRYKGEDWGAIVGPHSVKITTENLIEDTETGEMRFVKEVLPSTYHARTTLTAVVEPGENVIDFPLESRPSRQRR
jgi:hypothetical protein